MTPHKTQKYFSACPYNRDLPTPCARGDAQFWVLLIIDTLPKALFDHHKIIIYNLAVQTEKRVDDVTKLL